MTPSRHLRLASHLALAAMLLSPAAIMAQEAPPAEQPPGLEAKPVTETYYGQEVTDRFRYVEDLSPEVIDWMKAQGGYTRALFDSIAPRAKIAARIEELGQGSGFVNSLSIAGDRLFYMERAPGAEAFDLVWRGPDGARHVLVDTAALIAKGGKPVAIEHFSPSPDGKRVAVGLSESGSESSRLRVLDVETGETIAGPIWQGAFGGEAWAADGSGLYVYRLREPFEGMDPSEVYLNSEVVWWDTKADPKPLVGAAYQLGPNSDPVRFPVIVPLRGTDKLMLLVANGVQNEIEAWIADEGAVRAGKADWKKMIGVEDEVTNFTASPERVYFLTHKDAPNFKVTSAPIGTPASQATVEIAPQEGRFIERLGWAQDGLYVAGRNRLQGFLTHRSGGTDTPIAIAEGATVGSLYTEWDKPGARFEADGFVTPTTTFEVAAGSTTPRDMGLEQRPDLDMAKYRAEELEATAADGTKVPLSVLTAADGGGPRPFLLDAYGAYGISILPYFSTRRLALAEAGAGFAVCHVRGGGELGETWRLGGKDATKPNTWRDAIACAETLIAKGYTTPEMLTIEGGSAGGIMVGRAATERPDLFAAAISRVGDTNALRSETMPGGPANIPEFGTVANEQGFHNLYAMDAYQHVVDGTDYPAFMLTTGLTDPRVAPWQAAKMAARLMEASSAPVLLRVEQEAGHGLGTTRSTRDAEEADIAAFVFWQAGAPGWQPATK